MPTDEQERLPSPTRTELAVAAGLLEAYGDLNNQLTVEHATERLRELLSPAALWWSGPRSPISHPELPQSGQLGQLPRWRAPDSALLDKLAHTVLAAWRMALPPSMPGWGTPVLRLEVSNTEAAQQLAGLGMVGPYLIVPSIGGQYATEFSWRWPMRIGIGDGPRSNQWRRELEGSPYASLYDLRVMRPGDAEYFDIVFVDADVAPSGHTATCVVVLGESSSPAEGLMRGRKEEPKAAIVIGTASADLAWFEGVVREMAHDQPIDVALRIASPTSLIAADSELLPLTAVRQWSLELAEQLRRQSIGGTLLRRRAPGSRLHIVGTEAVFDQEQKGAARVASEVRSLERQGYETALKVSRGHAAASPPDEAAQPLEPGVVVVSKRRLIADARVGGRVRRKTLLPDMDHQLLVQIAVPKKGTTAAQIDFPQQDLPSNASVELMVDVTSAALDLRMRQPIVLSTADRTASSTTALFDFHTLGEGTVVDIKILVTYQERPLQEAHYVATVRSRHVASDQVRLTAVALSSSPEPRIGATRAQLSLEVNGANLERTGSRDAVNLVQLHELSDGIEMVASRVLAGNDAPETLAGRSSEELLVALAQSGAMLKRYLEPLRIDDAATISLLVEASTPVLPLELVYDSPAPQDSAKLCEHRSGGTMVGKPEVCSNAGEAVVCPNAFWGQQRVIARTIRVRNAPARRSPPAPAPFNLRPVLYAAVERADADAPEGEKPSDVLEAELTAMVGISKVTRVRDWDDWRVQVQEKRPQLLIVLGHTQSFGAQTGLEIGSGSWLREANIHTAFLRDQDSPPPLLVLLACSSAVPHNWSGGLPAAFTGSGAAAVVATLTKLRGPHGARAAAAVVRALCGGGRSPGQARLGAAMTAARRQLIEDGLLVGLLLVSHGEIDLPLGG